MITDDMIRQKYTTVIHPNRLLLLHRKKDRSEAENLEMARLQYFIEHAQAPAVPGPEAPYPETPFKNNPPMLILGNPSENPRGPLWEKIRKQGYNLWTWKVMKRMKVGPEEADRIVSEMYGVMSFQPSFKGRLLSGLSRKEFNWVMDAAALWAKSGAHAPILPQPPDPMVLPESYWRKNPVKKAALLREARESARMAASDVKAGHKGAAKYWEGRAAGLAQAALQNPDLECQYCGSGELVYMGQIGPNHAYRCRRCGMDLVVDIPPNPEYLARYISPYSEVREEVIKARGTRDAMKKAQRRADKLPPEFTAPRSSVEVAPIGGPNPAGQYEVVFRSAGERWYSGPFRTREDAEAYAKLGESGWYGPRGDWKRAPLQWRVVPSTSRQGPVQVLWPNPEKGAQKCQWFLNCKNRAVTTQSHPILGEVPICKRCKELYDRMSKRPNPYVAVDRMSGRVSSVQRGRDKGAAYESIKDWAEDISQYSGRAQDVYWKRHDSKRLKVGIPAPEDMMAANPSRLKRAKPLVPFGACYYDAREFGTTWITGKDRVPRWVCRRHLDVAREDTGRPNYNYRVFNRPRRRNPCGGRGANVDHHGIPGYIWNDPRFQAELRAYKRRHGTGPVEIRGIKVPKGYPKFMSVYGRAPHAVYDAPSHSTKGKRIHHFGGRGKSQPWLVSSVERGPKFLAYVGGTFRARPDWLYD